MARATSLVVLFLVAAAAVEMAIAGGGGGSGGGGGEDRVVCPGGSRWHGREVRCPGECPHRRPSQPRAKYCHVDCDAPVCEAGCKEPKPGCEHQGSGCYDPRFVGGDGVVFYFRGRQGEHFTLVSDARFQINARFIGFRPAGRAHDFTWIQALGFIFGSHAFTVEARRAPRWDDAVDHLRFSYDGDSLALPEGYLSSWTSPDGGRLTVHRTGRTNGVRVRLEGMAEASITVAPVTEEDDRVHRYQIPSGDCFAHLEVKFTFYGLSPAVEGVLGKTYQPDYVSPAKRGVAMPVLGGEDKYGTASLISPFCNACIYDPHVSPPADTNIILPAAAA